MGEAGGQQGLEHHGQLGPPGAGGAGRGGGGQLPAGGHVGQGEAPPPQVTQSASSRQGVTSNIWVL